jgi:hypothetical protein
MNAAAEDAFSACATEEESLWTYTAQLGAQRAAFVHLKAGMKRLLIDGKL